MAIIFIVFLWLLNFGISWWNAYACGKVWVESKFAGGWIRFMTWMGAIMSASGFTWCFLILLTLLGHAAAPKDITQEVVEMSFKLGYVILIPGILFSGFAITLDSWARAWKERSLSSMGVAGWNTFAQTYNTYNAIKDYGGAFKDVGKFFGDAFSSKSSSKDDGKAKAALLVIVLVIVALGAGTLLTATIIKRAAGSVPLPDRDRNRVTGGFTPRRYA